MCFSCVLCSPSRDFSASRVCRVFFSLSFVVAFVIVVIMIVVVIIIVVSRAFSHSASIFCVCADINKSFIHNV